VSDCNNKAGYFRFRLQHRIFINPVTTSGQMTDIRELCGERRLWNWKNGE